MGDQGPLTLMSSVGSPVHPPAPIQDRCVGTRAPGGMGLDLVRAASAPGDQPQLGLPRHRGPRPLRVAGGRWSRRTTNGFNG
jgi:hypothetical protein